MKKPMIVINGFSEKYEQRLGEVLGILPEEFLPERMICLCEEKFSMEKLKSFPVKSVAAVCSPVYDPEGILPVLEKLTRKEEWILFDSGYAAEELAVRLAARKNGVSATKIQSLELRDGQLYFQKMIYSNHMIGTFRITQHPCCLSLAPGGKERKMAVCQETEVRKISLECEIPGYHLDQSQGEAGLEKVQFLLAAGRGAGSKRNVQELEKIAGEIGAGFGVSRPAAMSAWAPMDRLIGVSGTLVKPKICIAAGASGAPAFYAGIEKSEFIVGINTDARAELVKKADVSIVGDCMEVLRELEQVIREKKK